MKASSSKVFDRVVNRTLYSKKVVLSIVFAFVMVASAFVIATSTRADNVTPSLEAWRLLPSEGWTKGDVKGYKEGDFIPVNLTLYKPADSSIVGARLGFEWGKNPETLNLVRGFDKVVMYGPSTEPDWIDDITLQALDPPGPFRPGEVGDPLFYAEPDTSGIPKGDLTATLVTDSDSNPLESDEYYSEDQRYWIAWDLVFDFDSPYESVEIYCGGLLFETTDTTKGASYYRGSSLHIRILGTLRDDGQGGLRYQSSGGSQDLPINVLEILTPPELRMLKTFDPDVRAPYEITTITLEIQNHGQTDAYMHDLFDYLPEELEYVGLLKTWTSKNPTRVSISYDPIHEDGDDTDDRSDCTYPHDPFPSVLHFEFTIPPLSAYAWLPGTAHDGSVWVRYFSFVVMVKADAEPGVVTNDAELTYTDDNLGPFWAYASDDLTIVKVAVSVTKVATIDQVEIDCAAVDYDVDGNLYIDPDSGDTVTYVITVTNDGTVPIRFEVYETYDDQPDVLIWSEPGTLLTEMLPPYTEFGPPNYVTNYFDHTFTGENHYVDWTNTVTVKAYDILSRQATAEASETIDLVYPDTTITKTADCSVAAVGEVVKYEIAVENTGDVTLEHFEIWDLMLDPDYPLYEATIVDPENDDADDLSPGETLTLRSSGDPEPGVVIVPALAHEIVQDDVGLDGKITNTAYIEAYDTQEHYLYREDKVEIRHVSPSIKITKTAVEDVGGPEITQVDPSMDYVIYRIEVDNDGDVGLWWFYWDDFADPDWTPEDEGPLPYDSTYLIDGCWAVVSADTDGDGEEDDGVYCGQVPKATGSLSGVVGITTHDTFVGTEYSYEVEITSYDAWHWRAGVYFRYTSPGNTYVAHIDDGIYLYKVPGSGAPLDSDAGPDFVSGTPYVLKVDVDQIDDLTPDGQLHIQVYVDGTPYLEYLDDSPLSGNKIGLSVWDETQCDVHVHFDDVIVRDISDPDTILLEDHFTCLVPYDPASLSTPEIPFVDPPGIPDDLECPYYCGRLASGYLEPGDNAEEPGTPDNPTDVRYYAYELQEDDPYELWDHVYVYGWHTADGTIETDVVHPTPYVRWTDDAMVLRKAAIWGYAFNDVHKTNPLGPWPYGMYDGVRNKDSGGNYYPDEYGLTTTRIVITLWDWDGTYDGDGNPTGKTIPRSTVTVDDPTYGAGYYRFTMLDPGDYVVDVTIINPLSMNPLSPLYGSWFVTRYEWHVVEDLCGGDEVQKDFGMARYGWIESYKWFDWNPNGVLETGIGEVGLNGWGIRVRGVDYEGNYYPGPDADDYAIMLTDDWEDIETGTPNPLIWDGWYKFLLKPGVYDVWEVLPDGWGTSTLILQPGSDPEEYAPHYHDIYVTDGAGDYSAKFGNFPLVKIWGIKFFDKDYDGVQDWVDSVGGPDDNNEWDPGEETEPGLNGWTIKLWRYDALDDEYYEYPSAAHQMTYVTATVDDIKGYYEFCDLPPGEYKLTEDIDINVWVMTTDPLVLEGIGPDFPQDPQQAGPVTLDPVKIGNLRYAKIAGYKFIDSFGDNDAWPDGIFDRNNPEEVGKEGWAITLVGTTLWGETVKYDLDIFDPEWDGYPEVTADGFGDDPLGYYCYDKVLPGEYWVSELLQQNWVSTNGTSHYWQVPAYPLGPQIVIWQCFGNVEPTADQDPEVPFYLKAGWNVWSSPVEVIDLTAKGLLSAIGPAGLAVVKYDAASDEMVTVTKNSPPELDYGIVFGQGYYVLTTADAYFSVMGYARASSQVDLVAGWNFIGYNLLKPIMASELLAKVTGCGAIALVYEDLQTGAIFTYTVNSPAELNFHVVSGKAYWLLTSGAGQLTF